MPININSKYIWIIGTMTITILIVEDNDLNLKYFNGFLQTHGYHTLKNKNSTKAVTMVEEYCPDLILMDIKLPNISGFEIVRMIKL
jgi:two-component system cell cycle response regulator DivK